MDYNFNEEQKLIQKMVQEFTEKEVAPLDEHMDKSGEYPKELITKMAENGFFGIPYPEELGGAGGDSICGVLATSELAKGSLSIAFTLATHWVACDALNFFANDEQRERLLRPLLEGEKLGAFSITEPCAGSDSAAIISNAERDGDDWVLNGTKAFVTNGGVADLYVICVKTDKTQGARGISAFVIEKDNPGLIAGKKEDKMGLRGSVTAEMILKNCRVPGANLLGKEGEGFKIAMKILDSGRMQFGAQGLGLAEACLKVASKYARERKAFGKPLSELQSVQFMIANMASEIELVKTLLFKVAWMRDKGMNFTKEAAILKLFSSEMAMKAAKDAIQILGGYGYTRDYPPERYLRDAKVLEIAEGANEIMRYVIGSMVLKA